ncbi:MAG: Crp/Fnr family transcriptional regulator [Bradymonadaceae bacterium]
MPSQDLARYQEILSSRSPFDDFGDEALATLIKACEPKIFAPRESLWSVGSVGDEAFILISGKVEQVRRLQPDGQRTEHFTEPGTLLSLSGLVHPWKHLTAAYTLERTEALRLSLEDFQTMFDAGEMAAYNLVDAVAENLVHEMRDANRRLHEVFGHPAETLRTLRRRVRGG